MTDGPDQDVRRRCHEWFAATANNAAWELVETSVRIPEQDLELLDVAHAARWHWAAVGTPLQQARADLLLCLVHAQLGDGPLAEILLHRLAPTIDEAGPEPWERALLAVARAAVAAATGDDDEHRAARSTAERLVVGLADPEEQAIVMASLDGVPAAD